MKILQIIPAQPGWNVVYPAGAVEPAPGQEEAGGVVFVPVACWGLIQDEGGNRVVPMSPSGEGGALKTQDRKALGVAPPESRPRDWIDRLAPAPAPKPKPKPKPAPAPEPVPEPTPVRVNDPEPAEAAPAITMDDVMDARFSVTPEAPPPATPDGIPAGDVLDLDF